MNRTRAAIVASDVTWEPQLPFAADHPQPNDQFGSSVAIDADVALVGAQSHDVVVAGTTHSGAGTVYVWRKSAGKWGFEQALFPMDAGDQYGFGRAVSVSGDTAAVSASNGGNDAIYIFSFDSAGKTWTQTKELTGINGEGFGQALALRGDQLLVGAPNNNGASGAVYLLTRTGSDWTQQTLPFAAQPGDALGFSVALGAGIAVAGAPTAAAFSGAAYALPLTGSAAPVSLVPPDDLTFSYFGWSVAVEPVSSAPNTIVVGAPSFNPTATTGAVFAFVGSSATWSYQQRLIPDDAGTSDSFGTSVALGSDVLVSNSPVAHTGDGAVYLYTRDASVWSPRPRLVGDDSYSFGISVALSGREVLLGIPSFVVAGMQPDGQAEVLSLTGGSTCTQDSDCTLGHCSEGVCCDSACTDACRSCLKAFTGADVDGVCKPALLGMNPRAECVSEPSSSCGQTGVCDDAGSCALYGKTTSCAGQACTATNHLGVSNCNGQGACKTSDGQDCGDFLCSEAGQCVTPCQGDVDCPSTGYCDLASNRCKVRHLVACAADGTSLNLLDGSSQSCGAFLCDGKQCRTTCDTSNDCAAGFSCVDGVCCDKPCDGPCESCLSANTNAGADGICAPVRAGKDPRKRCDADPQTSCGQTGLCDGDGNCAKFSEGTECAAASCAAPDTVTSSSCDGKGKCVAEPRSCGLSLCSGTDCVGMCGSDDDCAVPAYCSTITNHCEARAPLKCTDDASSLISYDSITQTSCHEYRCKGDKCLTTCAISDDCAQGLFCDAGKCSPVQGLSPAGASCAFAPDRSTQHAWFWFFTPCLLGSWVRRRRVRRRRTHFLVSPSFFEEREQIQ